MLIYYSHYGGVMITCDQALKIYEKLKNEILRDKEVYPAGKLLLCMDNVVSETSDIDVEVKGLPHFDKTVVDNTVVHMFPYRSELDECRNLPYPTATYYCIKYKLLLMSLRHRGARHG